MNLYRFLALLLAFFPQALQASELPIYETWNQRLMDNPIATVEAIKARRNQLDKRQSPEEWVQLTLAVTRDANIIDPSARPPKYEITEALNLARQLSLDAARILLEYEDSGRDDQTNATLVNQAVALNLPRTQALLLNSRGSEYFYKGRYADSLQAAREALRAMRQAPGVKDVDLVTFKSDLASVLDYLGDIKQARSLYDEILKTLESTPYHYIIGVVCYNYAAMLRDKADWDFAETLYQKAIKAMASIQEKVVHALSKKGLAEILIKKGQLSEATAQINQTMAALEALGVLPDAVADTWRLRAKVLILQKQWNEGLDAVKKARVAQLANNRRYQSDLLLLEADAWNGLREHAKASVAAKQSAELLKEQMNADRQGEIAKLSVQLGLELEEQKNALLTQKIRESALIQKALIFVSALSLLVLLLLIAASILLRQVTRSRRQMKRILDNIEEGFVTINAELRCRTDFSPYMEQLLGLSHAALKNLDVLDLLLKRSDLSDDQQAIIRSALQASLGEDELAWELNAAHFPQELNLDQGQRTISLHWQVLGASHRVRFVLLAIRDVTARKRLQHAERRAAQLETLSQELWQTDLPQVFRFFDSMQQPWTRIQDATSLSPEQRRLLHTWKGNARALGLRSLADAIHHVESTIEELPHLGEWINAYSSLLDKLQTFGHAPASAETLWTRINEADHDLRTLLQQHKLDYEAFSCEDHFGRWNSKLLDLVHVVLVHGISNAIDHGFVRPMQRRQAVTRSVRLQFRASLQNQKLQLELEDNGYGLDEVLLRRLAQSRGFRADQGQSIAAVLFEDGVTTSEDISASSGRGVGLAAIRQEVQAHRGECRLESAPAGGTILQVLIPLPIT